MILLNHLLTGMSVLSVSEETKDKIRAKINIDEQRIKEAVKILQEWLETQPHLPHDYGKYHNDSLTLFGFKSVYLKPLLETGRDRWHVWVMGNARDL
jgi:hypothetical protein